MKTWVLADFGHFSKIRIWTPKKPEFWSFLGVSAGHFFLAFFGLFLVQPKLVIDFFLSRNIYKYLFINVVEVIDKSF